MKRIFLLILMFLSTDSFACVPVPEDLKKTFGYLVLSLDSPYYYLIRVTIIFPVSYLIARYKPKMISLAVLLIAFPLGENFSRIEDILHVKKYGKNVSEVCKSYETISDLLPSLSITGLGIILCLLGYSQYKNKSKDI